MTVNMWRNLSGDRKDSRIRDDQSVRSIRLHVFKLRQILTHTIQIIVMCQNIGSHIHLHLMRMCESDTFRHLLLREVLGLCPKSKRLTSDIDRIRSIDHGNS